jgi:hypothetical protein
MAQNDETEQYEAQIQKGKKRVTLLGIVFLIIGILLIAISILPNNPLRPLISSNLEGFSLVAIGLLVIGSFFLAASKLGTQPPIPTKTIKNFTITGYPKSHIKDAVHNWIIEEKINVETERDDFIRGNLGTGLVGAFEGAQTFFEVYIFAKQDDVGFDVNTYGWVKQQGRRPYLPQVTSLRRTPHYIEMELAGNAKRLGVERRNGLKVINNLWTKLETMTNKV